MKTIRDLMYGVEDAAQAMDLYIPEGETRRTFVYFHGGGLEGGDKRHMEMHAQTLTERGIALASANYRMYPQAGFPVFIEDAARAVAKVLARAKGDVYVGGSSAGAYLAMMLYLDKRYLLRAGAAAERVAGWVFDAGQPTTHYNVLRERGEDVRLVRVDEAAPIYFVGENSFDPSARMPEILMLCADNDMPGRLEQNRLLARTMQNFGFPAEKIHFKLMENSRHCEYDGLPVFGEILADFILS